MIIHQLQPTIFRDFRQGEILPIGNRGCPEPIENRVNISSSFIINIILAGSYVCNCQIGYQPSDDATSCIDINECKERVSCENGKCVNTLGSFLCQCNTGYKLEKLAMVCIGEGVFRGVNDSTEGRTGFGIFWDFFRVIYTSGVKNNEKHLSGNFSEFEKLSSVRGWFRKILQIVLKT